MVGPARSQLRTRAPPGYLYLAQPLSVLMTIRLRSHGPRLSLPIPSPTRFFRDGMRTPDDRATLVALVHDFVLPHARHDFSCRTRRFPDDQAALVAGSTIVFTGPEPGVGISPRQDVTSAHLLFFHRLAPLTGSLNQTACTACSTGNQAYLLTIVYK